VVWWNVFFEGVLVNSVVSLMCWVALSSCYDVMISRLLVIVVKSSVFEYGWDVIVFWCSCKVVVVSCELGL